MQLRINTVNLKVLENLENILYSDDRKIGKRFAENLPWEVYDNLSPQYEIQVLSSMQIRKNLWPKSIKNIKWIYFWTEQCEFLLPNVEEIKKAVVLLKEFDKKYVTKDIKQFVFLTPYYWNQIIRDRLIEDLEYLNENAWYINKKTKTVEVVVNDFWTLRLLEKYSNLKPILGRLIVKTLKTPIVDTLWMEKNVHIPWELMKNKSQEEIIKIKKQIAQNQKKWIASSAISNKYFTNFFEKKWLYRYWIDYLKDSKELYKPISWKDEIKIDIYYPYANVFVWRLCDTSAIEDIKRWYYPIDKVCPRTCWKYDMFIKNMETVWYKLFQRWNAQYKSQVELELYEDTIEKYENRLIYTPLI